MNKIIKYSLWSASVAVIAALAGVAYLAATFNPNDYKTQIIQLVQDKKQRTLKLDGDIKLVFFPSIGVNLGKVSLSEFQSDHEFLAIDSARVSLALLPLLAKQFVVDEVVVKGLKVGLVKFKNGHTNIDDLLTKEESKSEGQPVKFDITAVHLENSGLSYRDETTRTQYALQDLSLHTGRIANNVPCKIDFFALIQTSQPKLDIALQLATTLTFDLQQQLYQMEDMKLQVKGMALDINNLVIQASGNASARLATHEFTAKNLLATAGGVKGKDTFDVRLNAPALYLTKDKFLGDSVTMNARLGGAMDGIAANFTLHDLSGNVQLFKSRALTLEVDMKQPDQAFKVKLGSSMSGNFEQQQVNLSDLTMAVQANGDRLPNKSVSSEMKGSVQIDGSRQSVQANLAGGLLQSQVKARVSVSNFTAPAIRFDVEADQFDADLYLPQEKVSGGAAANRAEQPLDLSALQALNLEGGLRIGALKVANIKLSQVRLDLKAHNGEIIVNPLSANLYQGSTNGSLSVHAQKAPTISINQKLSDINIAPLLKDALDLDMIEGRGNVTLNLSAQGNSVSALKKALNGDLAMNLTEGAIRGIDLTSLIRDAQALGKGGVPQTKTADKNAKTQFSEFRASFKVSNGVAHNEDLSVKSPLLRLSGKGDINIGSDSINYTARATLSKSPDGQGGGVTVPVTVSGPYSNLKYMLDFGAMVVDMAKQKIEAKKEQLKSQAQEKLKSKLKDLFK